MRLNMIKIKNDEIIEDIDDFIDNIPKRNCRGG